MNNPIVLLLTTILLCACSQNTENIRSTKTNKDMSCNNCDKNSCDTSCNSTETGNLKSLLPSCNLSEDALKMRKKDLTTNGILHKASHILELENGFDFVFHQPKAFSQDILDYVNFERSCCSDFWFAIEFEPNEGAIHLKIFGSTDIKQQMKNLMYELKIMQK